MNDELLIVVDEHDNAIAEAGKIEVHKKGILHRAFSVFVFNSEGKWLLQQRAEDKYHSAGLWTNTCCSHPRRGEVTEEAAVKRLNEEMGIVCGLKYMFNFTYKASFENGLTEHEFDHIFSGYSDDLPVINKAEVKAYKYLSTEEIRSEINDKPETFTRWFVMMFEKVNQYNTDKTTA